MVKIQVKFSQFHKMDIWEVHSNSYGFLLLCGSLISWVLSCSIKRSYETPKEVRQFHTSIKSYSTICLLVFHL